MQRERRRGFKKKKMRTRSRTKGSGGGLKKKKNNKKQNKKRRTFGRGLVIHRGTAGSPSPLSSPFFSILYFSHLFSLLLSSSPFFFLFLLLFFFFSPFFSAVMARPFSILFLHKSAKKCKKVQILLKGRLNNGGKEEIQHRKRGTAGLF